MSDDPELVELRRRRRAVLDQILAVLNEHSEVMAPKEIELCDDPDHPDLTGPFFASGFVINVVWTDLGSTSDDPSESQWSRPDYHAVLWSAARGLGLELAAL